MDDREFNVIENKEKTEKEQNVDEKLKHHTNPILKKLAKFHLEKAEKFSVKDLFKK